MIYICQRIPETDKANLAGRRRKRSKLELTLLNFPRLPSVRQSAARTSTKTSFHIFVGCPAAAEAGSSPAAQLRSLLLLVHFLSLTVTAPVTVNPLCRVSVCVCVWMCVRGVWIYSESVMSAAKARMYRFRAQTVRTTLDWSKPAGEFCCMRVRQRGESVYVERKSR